MKAVIGLGNPGAKYEGTRHNVGFEVVKALLEKAAPGKKFKSVELKSGDSVEKALVAEWEDDLLVLPQMFMNNSGGCVRAVAQARNVALGDLLIVSDDVNLPCGKIRFRREGSAGGQHGLESVIEALGTQEFSRLRVGVGPTEPKKDLTTFVLERFEAGEKKAVAEAVEKCGEAILYWKDKGIEAAMNKYN